MTATSPPRPGAGEGEPDDFGEEMTLVEHLRELRERLFKSGIAVVVGFAVGFVFRHPLFNLLIQPYCELDPSLRLGSTAFDAESCDLIFTNPIAPFFISLKAAAVVAIVIAGPIVSYQIWRFVTPGLRSIERRYALPFLVVSQFFFLGGAVFSYFVIPRGLEFLLGLAGPNIVSLLDASEYLSFLLQVMLGFGLAFEFPLALIMLAAVGVVSAASLRQARRYAYFGTFVAAAIITPTQDPITLSLMAVPLIGFYEIAILTARLIERRRRRAGVAP